jgi:hypothetical protein
VVQQWLVACESQLMHMFEANKYLTASVQMVAASNIWSIVVHARHDCGHESARNSSRQKSTQYWASCSSIPLHCSTLRNSLLFCRFASSRRLGALSFKAMIESSSSGASNEQYGKMSSAALGAVGPVLLFTAPFAVNTFKQSIKAAELGRMIW